MVKGMSGRKIVDSKTTEELMDMLELKETADGLTKVNGIR